MSFRTVSCPLHGVISLTERMCLIIDTPEFQRLHRLKQLGLTQHVYPSATHTRFEHSLGVSHLAKVLVTSLKEKGLDIDSNMIELYQIAGLIHDIGHGPFSHLYDDEIINPGEPKHEERGINIFFDMLMKYNLPFIQTEVDFIVALIEPCDIQKNNWMYQIINNKFCSIDVDKIDYIQRDCFHTGLGFGGEWSRLLTMCKVRKSANNEQETIIWPVKLQDEIFQLFAARYRLHKHVCTHHTVKAYEYLIVDILKKARSQVDHFTDLTDSVVTCRLHSEFREIQEKIARKEIPILVGEKIIDESIEEGGVYPRRILDLIIDKFYIGLSSGSYNPLMNVPYEDWDGNIFKLDAKDMRLCQPTKHKETIVRMYTFSPGQMTEARKDWKANW